MWDSPIKLLLGMVNIIGFTSVEFDWHLVFQFDWLNPRVSNHPGYSLVQLPRKRYVWHDCFVCFCWSNPLNVQQSTCLFFMVNLIIHLKVHGGTKVLSLQYRFRFHDWLKSTSITHNSWFFSDWNPYFPAFTIWLVVWNTNFIVPFS